MQICEVAEERKRGETAWLLQGIKAVVVDSSNLAKTFGKQK